MLVAEHIPNATYVELPGDKHLAYMGDADAYLRAIREFLVDEPAAMVVPAASKRVLASVLFTDLVGSTESQVRLGDDTYRELMNRHDDLSQQQIRRYRGRFIQSTTNQCHCLCGGYSRRRVEYRSPDASRHSHGRD